MKNKKKKKVSSLLAIFIFVAIFVAIEFWLIDFAKAAACPGTCRVFGCNFYNEVDQSGDCSYYQNCCISNSVLLKQNPEPGDPNAAPTPARNQALGLSGGPYTNQEKIPGAPPTSDFITYLKSIINFGFAIVGILALFMLIIGAYQYLMAAGSGNASDAKDTVASALLGLVLGLTAWVILNTINPDLVKMNPIKQIQGTNTSAK